MFYWDTVSEEVRAITVVGDGILDGQRVVAVRFGPVTEWVHPDVLHEFSDDVFLTEMIQRGKERRKLKH